MVTVAGGRRGPQWFKVSASGFTNPLAPGAGEIGAFQATPKRPPEEAPAGGPRWGSASPASPSSCNRAVPASGRPSTALRDDTPGLPAPTGRVVDTRTAC